MPKIVKNGKEYSGVPIEVVTAWQPTGDPVQVAEPLMGNTDISDIGDGTITGAISAVDAGLTQLIKTVSFTETTSSGGNVYHDFDGNVFVLGASCNKSDTFIVPFVSINSGNPYWSRWWFNARTAGTSGSAVTGTSMTVTVAYIVMN